MKNIHPQFEQMAAQGVADEVWLWLDLVDHGEFIEHCQPDNCRHFSYITATIWCIATQLSILNVH
ncbi:hypothetical protein [Massilia pseudoviolaceinigra]|uniref:hypothetical protein n=1 Tax=Massilia pseudoviolaceinigra TaxID=3057165 RepID=UPI00279644B6|nr:hypothetical protein [Massilia sp. CCM 9206]MDQ1918732.1 hypothetical protein [Massilia sp. CCM 9206]